MQWIDAFLVSFLASIAYLAMAMWEICCTFVRTSIALGLWSFATSRILSFWVPQHSTVKYARTYLWPSTSPSSLDQYEGWQLQTLQILSSLLFPDPSNVYWTISFSSSICSWRIIPALSNKLPKPDTTHPDSQLGTAWSHMWMGGPSCVWEHLG